MSELSIPFQDKGDRLHLGEIHDLVHEAISDPKEQKVTYELLFELATTSGIDTYGDLLDRLEKVGTDGRRRLVDQARSSLGMESLADEEGHRAFEAANRALRMQPSYDEQGRRSVICAEANCNTWPQGELGEPIPVADRVWWCDRHRHLAGPEDHLPPEPKYVIDFATMSLRAVGKERERLLAEDEKLRRNAEEREQRRREESVRLGKLEEAYRASLRPRMSGFE